MGVAINAKNGGLWIGKQAAEGTEATSFNKLAWIGGTLATRKEPGKQEYIDGESFSNAFDFTNEIAANGTLRVTGDAPTLGRLIVAAIAATDVVTGAAAPYTHTATPGAPSSRAFYTIIQTEGTGSGAIRQKFVDCKLTRLTVEASQQSKVVVVEFEIVSKQPGVYEDADPASATTAGEPFLYTQGKGRYKVAGLNGGAALGAINQWRLNIATGEAPWYGDDVFPYKLIPGVGAIELDGTLLAEELTTPLIYEYLYDTATPADGAVPTNTVYYDQFELHLVDGTDEFKVTVPKLRYAIEELPQVDVEGGATTFSFSGEVRKPAAGDRITAVIKSGDSTAY